MRRFATAAAMYVGVLALAAVAVLASRDTATTVPPGPPGPDDVELVAALEPFDDCDELLRYFQDEGLKRVGPYGLDGMSPPFLEMAAPVAGSAASAADGDARALVDSAAAATGDGGGTDDFSGTNVQEAGVDEPDTVKTNGEILVVLANERLRIFGVSPSGLRRLGALRVPSGWGSEIVLDGDRVLILGQAMSDAIPLPGPAVDVDAPWGGPVMGGSISTLRMVDISDPASPELLSTLELDGAYVSARVVDGIARVVLRSQPSALPFVTPQAGGLRAERQAEARNREVIRESTIDQWLPYAVLTDERSGDETEQTLLDCTTVHHPETFAGFGIVSVVSVDLARELEPEGSAGVIGAAETVYASTDNLYVALNRWHDPVLDAGGRSDRVAAPETTTTDLHQFDISAPGTATYVASGAVTGRLLNQWALSEHNGHLRVATTVDDFTGRRASESAVTILRATDGALERVGRVDGLGKTEQIYAVRFEGDTGYVVTFRQTDPLYTLDLSDPADPRTVGELKINGYSAYLHPVDDGRILGIGQDATKDGQTTGSQVSLFDVSDLGDPARLDQLDLGPGSSAVEYDHRAFTYWPATRTAVVPLQSWERRPFSGVVVLRVGDGMLRREGEITHATRVKNDPGYCCNEGPFISRSIVIGDALLTVSDAGVMLNGLDDLQRRDWASF